MSVRGMSMHPTGGETQIMQPHLLGNFWQSFQPSKGLELTDIMQLVPSPFGQLTLFDPRMPHGVRPVSGTRDPQQVHVCFVCNVAVVRPRSVWLVATCCALSNVLAEALNAQHD